MCIRDSEHIDHIQGLGVFSRKYEVPVYATSGTIQGIKCAKSLGKLPEGLLHEVKADETFRLGDLDIHPVSYTHLDVYKRQVQKDSEVKI